MRTTLFVGLCLFVVTTAFADAVSYRKSAIADASRFVAERKAAALAAEGAGPRILENLALTRFYKAGDRWIVAVSRVSPGMVHAVDSPAAHQNHFLDPVFYEFHVVLSMEQGDAVKVEVTQVRADGKVDRTRPAPRTLLTINRQMKLDLVADAKLRLGFDAFPIALPDFAQARLLAPGMFPSAGVPRGILSSHQQHVVVSEQAVSFESLDLYSRPVRVLWQRGDLWPAEVETTSGYSMLIRQEKI